MKTFITMLFSFIIAIGVFIGAFIFIDEMIPKKEKKTELKPEIVIIDNTKKDYGKSYNNLEELLSDNSENKIDEHSKKQKEIEYNYKRDDNKIKEEVEEENKKLASLIKDKVQNFNVEDIKNDSIDFAKNLLESFKK